MKLLLSGLISVLVAMRILLKLLLRIFYLGNHLIKKLYVGGLSYGTTEESLVDLFLEAGEIDSVKLITDRDTGRSKGFAFVEMSTDQGAQDAIKRFNGRELDGRRLSVSEARPQAPRQSQGSRW